jgi:spore cortex biosynthesis protein YabQ
MNNGREFFILFQLVIAGLAIGLLFDLYRLLRWLLRPGRVGTYVGDLLFWLVLTPILFFLLLSTNGGELRLYVFVVLAVGCLLYFRLFSRWFLRLATAFWRGVRRVARGLERAMLGTLRVLFRRFVGWQGKGWLGGLPPEPEKPTPSLSVDTCRKESSLRPRIIKHGLDQQ